MGVVEALTDASFAPEATRSCECTMLVVEGCLVGWHVARQPYMAQSSCEAELLATSTGCCYVQAHTYVLAELNQEGPRVYVYNDNEAAISVFSEQSTHWRTRSLRIRAKVMKERWDMGFYSVLHIEGIHNGADLGTKALAAQRIRVLCTLLGVAEVTNRASVSRLKPVWDASTCLRVVVIACLICQVEGQPHAVQEEGSVWWFWFGVVVAAVLCWEGFKLSCRTCWGWVVSTVVVSVLGGFGFMLGVLKGMSLCQKMRSKTCKPKLSTVMRNRKHFVGVG